MIALHAPPMCLSRLVPSGSIRVMLVSMLLGPFAFLPLMADSIGKGDDAVPLAIGLSALGGAIAGAALILFRMFRWIVDGYDGAVRRRLVQFGATVALAGFALMFREEVSPPFPTEEGCWYSVRDRWTGGVEMRLAKCSAEAKPRHRPNRIIPVLGPERGLSARPAPA